MRRGRLGRLGEALLAVAVLGVALAVLADSAQRVPWHQDEGLTLYSSRYFNYLFLERDLGRPEWGDNHWTVTQPMLVRYLIGAAIWARGYDFARLEDYNFHRRFTANRERGVLPVDARLMDIRTPMVLLGGGAILLLYLLGRRLGGVLAGLVAAAFGLASPLAQEWLVRAKGEAPLACLLLLALLVAIVGARRGRDGALPWGWALALGLVLG